MIFFRKVEDRKTKFSIVNQTDSSIFTNISEDLAVIMLNPWFCFWIERLYRFFEVKNNEENIFLNAKKKIFLSKESYQ